jgi:hypothetical protein
MMIDFPSACRRSTNHYACKAVQKPARGGGGQQGHECTRIPTNQQVKPSFDIQLSYFEFPAGINRMNGNYIDKLSFY